MDEFRARGWFEVSIVFDTNRRRIVLRIFAFARANCITCMRTYIFTWIWHYYAYTGTKTTKLSGTWHRHSEYATADASCWKKAVQKRFRLGKCIALCSSGGAKWEIWLPPGECMLLIIIWVNPSSLMLRRLQKSFTMMPSLSMPLNKQPNKLCVKNAMPKMDIDCFLAALAAIRMRSKTKRRVYRIKRYWISKSNAPLQYSRKWALLWTTLCLP